MAEPLERRLSAARLRLRVRDPFFATLSLFARLIPRPEIPSAQNDGQDIFYRPSFFEALDHRELEAVLLHEILHAALLHVQRRGGREAIRWNVAADVVVNGIIAQLPGLLLPSGALREPKLEQHSVEEIYALLPDSLPKVPLCMTDEGGTSAALQRLAEAEAHWRHALHQARAIAQDSGRGDLPAELLRILEEISHPQIDWRSALWRFLVRTPTDFQHFDRRFVHQGLYLEGLDGESVRVFIAVDTSGSISQETLKGFLAEVLGLLSSYPHIEALLFYADAALDGPHPIELQEGAIELPPPRGGGGTSFIPFFDWVEAKEGSEEQVCVYLTDGYGSFPNSPPNSPVLWVVPPGGLRSFPFGEVIRLAHGAVP